jgi:hypothetical protein
LTNIYWSLIKQISEKITNTNITTVKIKIDSFSFHSNYFLKICKILLTYFPFINQYSHLQCEIDNRLKYELNFLFKLPISIIPLNRTCLSGIIYLILLIFRQIGKQCGQENKMVNKITRQFCKSLNLIFYSLIWTHNVFFVDWIKA